MDKNSIDKYVNKITHLEHKFNYFSEQQKLCSDATFYDVQFRF